MIDPDQVIVELRTAEDLTPAILSEAVECAFGADLIGNRPGIDWEYAYDMLERVYGYFVVEMDNEADRAIRAAVRKARKEGRKE